MDTTFVYNRHATGKYFVGRKNEVNILSNMLSQHENIAIYDIPKSGKTSLIHQAFYNMKINTQRFDVSEFSLSNIRTIADLCLRFGSTIISDACSTPDEYEIAVTENLEGTHFIFDRQVYSDSGMVLSLNWDLDDNDISAVFKLPYRLAERKRQKRYVVLDEFQNVTLTEDGDKVCKIIHHIFEELQADQKGYCSYIFSGSCVNAMKDIFEQRKLFYRSVEHVELGMFETKELIDHFARAFMIGGKVIDRNLTMGACELFRNNIWYLNHFGAICDSLSRGYMNETIMEEALNDMIALHEPRFRGIVNDLTTFQVCLLRAILDGHVKFSSTEVIQRYKLNSSANVRRLKDALCKKEIITFDNEDRPVILDPLFEYWVKKYYFHINDNRG